MTKYPQHMINVPLAERIDVDKSEFIQSAIKKSEATLWEQLLRLHYHRVTAEVRALDQSATRPRLSDWKKSDHTGADGTWFEFEPGASPALGISVHSENTDDAVGELLSLPESDSLGWTGFTWAVPGHPHRVHVRDTNGKPLDVVARWDGSPGLVVLPLPATLPDAMILLYGIENGGDPRRLLACSGPKWKRSRLAEVLHDTLPDPNKALQAILRANEVAVREDARGTIQETKDSASADGRPFKQSEVNAFHADLLAASAVLLLPPRALLESDALGWMRFRLGWEDPELKTVTREKPTDSSGAYVVRNLIEIVVEESSR